MHTVVARSTIHDFEKGRTFLREQGIPRVTQAPGFVGAQWVRLAENKGTSMLTFETEDAARASAEQLRANPPPGDAVTIDSIEIGEVVERI
jgi:hypothetical protein